MAGFGLVLDKEALTKIVVMRKMETSPNVMTRQRIGTSFSMWRTVAEITQGVVVFEIQKMLFTRGEVTFRKPKCAKQQIMETDGMDWKKVISL